MKIIDNKIDRSIALTYDDVLLLPQKSCVIPCEVDVQTELFSNIKLNIPIISAAMDTVTGPKMAATMARLGGIGIIHKNQSIIKQVQNVLRVKKSEDGFITNPICISPFAKIVDVKKIMKKFAISGIPVVNENNCLIGMVTRRDVKYCNNNNDQVNIVMTTKLITADKSISISKAKELLKKHKIEKLPLIDSNNKICGLIASKDVDQEIDYPNSISDNNNNLLVGAAISPSTDAIERLNALVKAKIDLIVVDSAHGHSVTVIKLVKKIHKLYPNLPIVAGNVVTKEAALDLVAAGAKCIKVGIGPGSICTTRIVSGVGLPQISALLEIKDALKDKNIKIIADGGIKYSGDITKALAAGADAVMIGNLFAGCDETPGEEIIYNGRKFKIYRGMGSLSAMQSGSSDRYFQTKNIISKLVPEGVEGMVPYSGNLSNIIYQLIGGLKSGMGYCGTKNLKELQTKSKFRIISYASLKKGHPYNIIAIKDAPNYSFKNE